LTVIEDAFPPTARESRVLFALLDASGTIHPLLIDPSLTEPLGGSSALSGSDVVVSGHALPESPGLIRVSEIHPRTAPPQIAASASQPWITLLCRYPNLGTTRPRRSWFEGLMSAAYPGLDGF
jgi:hypothetical protein